MTIIPNDRFLGWAAEAGLVPDPRYPDSRQKLVFAASPDFCDSWPFPEDAAERMSFLRAAIRLAGGADGCWLRLRGGGTWVAEPSSDESAFDLALRALGVPFDVDGALAFSRDEVETAVKLADACAEHGFCVGTDLEIVPVDRAFCLLVSHHDDLHVQAVDGAALQAFSAGMKAAGHETYYEDDDA